MPKIQLIRRDSSVMELDAHLVSFDWNRSVMVQPIPIIAQRVALDLNMTNIGIVIDGILVDDEGEVGGNGSAFTMDLSQGAGSIPSSTWYGQYSISTGAWNTVKADLHGVDIAFKSIGQVTAGLGEVTHIRLRNGATTSSVGGSIIGVNISSTTNTQTLATAIADAVNAASITVNSSTVTFISQFTASQSVGQQEYNSYYHQTGDLAQYHQGERIQIKNDTIGEKGDVSVTVQKGEDDGANTYALVDGTLAAWDKAFVVTNMTGGQSVSKMTMGDKVQELLNTTNMSAGGALLSANTFTGAVLDIPDGVASLDASRFLNLEEAAVVKKYIVGVRIPYESIVSDTTGAGARLLRQFLIPAGPGTDFSAAKNTGEYDPSRVVNNEVIRPNPFLEQGVAIPAVMMTFRPSYNAGDGFWTYQITLAAAEQLIGI